MTTINPVQTFSIQAPTFKGNTTKAQLKSIDTINESFKNILIKDLAKTYPKKAKTLIFQDIMSKATFKDIVKFLITGKIK